MKKRLRLTKGKKDGKKQETRKEKNLSYNYRRKKEKKQKVDTIIISDEEGSAGSTCAPLHSIKSQTGVTPLGRQDGTFLDGTFTPPQQTLQSTSLSLPQSRTSEELTHLFQHQNNPSNEYKTPRGLLNKLVESNCGVKRALDFNSSEVASSCSTGEDTFCGPDNRDATSDNYYREEQMGNEELKNNMACKLCRIKINVLVSNMKFCRHNILQHQVFAFSRFSC